MGGELPKTSEAEQPAPPKTVAVIDIGANSVRMVVAEVFDDGRIEVLDRVRQPVRLGHDTFVKGKLSQQTMRATLTVLRDYRRLMNTYGVDMVRAVATSAVREATNRDTFLDRITRAVGFDVDVIEPTEQSRLLVSAVRHTTHDLLGPKDQTTLIAEVGGGSTLLTILQGGEIVASQGFSLGSIRMQEMLLTAGEPPARSAELLRLHLSLIHI